MEALGYLVALCCAVMTATTVTDVYVRAKSRVMRARAAARIRALEHELAELRLRLLTGSPGARVVSAGFGLRRECGGALAHPGHDCGLLDIERVPQRLLDDYHRGHVSLEDLRQLQGRP